MNSNYLVPGLQNVWALKKFMKEMLTHLLFFSGNWLFHRHEFWFVNGLVQDNFLLFIAFFRDELISYRAGKLNVIQYFD